MLDATTLMSKALSLEEVVASPGGHPSCFPAHPTPSSCPWTLWTWLWSLLHLMAHKPRRVAQHGAEVSALVGRASQFPAQGQGGIWRGMHQTHEEGCRCAALLGLGAHWSTSCGDLFPCSFCLCCFKEIGFCVSFFFLVNKRD